MFLTRGGRKAILFVAILLCVHMSTCAYERVCKLVRRQFGEGLLSTTQVLIRLGGKLSNKAISLPLRFLLFVFEMGSHIAQANLQLTMNSQG